mmetsp:Transcript_23527/g.70665  ORF Transcript_23527/g.70665 Transcript_23527/m.70665 type:complete len:417 (-) Transcript_23527:8-1258(-)
MAETSAIDEFQDLDYARRRDRDFFETRARQRQTTSDYVSSGAFSVTTRDDDDHSFHGVVCDVELTAGVPIEYLEVTGVAVRGALGATKVLTAPGGFAPSPDASDRLEMRKYFSPLKPPHEWTLRFSGICPPARDEPRHLDFVEPARLAPDKLKNAPKNAPPPPLKLGLYIHSENAEGVVYNNQRHRGVTLEDAHVRVLSGVAHTGGAPFARVGYWGDNAWRERREFVGRVSYRVRLLLWTPENHTRFPAPFQEMANALLLSRAAKLLRGGATKIGIGHMPVEALYYVLSFMRHDWPGAAATPPPPPPPVDEEQWTVRRDGYGSRVLVKRSECVDTDEEEDSDQERYDEEFDDDFDDEDDSNEFDDFHDDDYRHTRSPDTDDESAASSESEVGMSVDPDAPTPPASPDAPPPPPPSA